MLEKIVEYYNILLSWFIDSGRGTEDYFIRTNLYKLMQSTSCRDILPMRYFKGLYNMGEVPENFKYRYSMLKLLDVDGYDRWKNFSAVYDINWNGF